MEAVYNNIVWLFALLGNNKKKKKQALKSCEEDHHPTLSIVYAQHAAATTIQRNMMGVKRPADTE